MAKNTNPSFRGKDIESQHLQGASQPSEMILLDVI